MSDKRAQTNPLINTFSTADAETDTYDLTHEREQKEAIGDQDVLFHWNKRGSRKGVQAVMSARHPLTENIQATVDLQQDIFEFLEGLIEGKNVFELGVGVGRMTAELAKRAKQVTGTDFSPIMLDRARANLASLENVCLHLGKITDLELPSKTFDLLFESIVLLHILNPEELRATIQKMQELSDRIFILEHTYEGPDFPISKYSILRKPEEYEVLFQPYTLVKKKTHLCAGDKFTMILFENPDAV